MTDNNIQLSVVMPVHNEPRQMILETVRSVMETIDVPYEFIAVDDASDQPLQPIDGVKVLRQEKNLGVGQAFRRGISEARSENLFLMGSDIRFLPNKWASQLVKEADDHPKAITCTTCVGINKDNMNIEERAKVSRRHGASILIFHDKRSHPKKPANFRNILEAKWLPPYQGEDQSSFEIPCVLGAAYVLKKEWADYIDLWWGHRSWGTLEPFFSLQSWLFGGSCRVAPAVETAHIFKSGGTHGTALHHLVYNKLLVATLLFKEEDTNRMINFLGNNPLMDGAWEIMKENEQQIADKKKEYADKIVVDVEEWCKRFEIDFRK